MTQQHTRWLDDDNNAERWYGNKKPYSAKDLISHWAVEAYKKLCNTDYDTFYFKIWQKTGCLMSVNGTDDDKIKLEGLNDYQLPPPMLLLDPANAEPSLNEITPAEDEPDDVDFDNEDMVPTDDTGEMEDKAEDWECDNPFVGRHVRVVY